MITHTIKLAVFALAITVSGAAQANEWTRSGPNGEVTRTYDAETGRTITRTGVNGGSTTANVRCTARGVVCQRNYSRTNPEGQSITGTRTTQRGLFRKRSVNTVTRADGTTATRVRTTPRYNAYRPGVRVNRVWRR